jgi:NAD(P)H-flavin reductase
VTKPENVPANWSGRSGFLTKEIIVSDVGDFADRAYYISGPEGMVSSYANLLKSMGVSNKQIVTDYFPGY